MYLFWDFLKHVQFYFLMGYYKTSIVVLNGLGFLPDDIFQPMFDLIICGCNKCIYKV